MDKCIREINTVDTHHQAIEVERCKKEIPIHVSKNVRSRVKRQNRAVLFNVPFNDDDKDPYLDGFTDFDLVVNLMFHANLDFKPKGCFRVLSGKNANDPRPPLVVVFPTLSHKQEFLSRCIGTINEIKETNTHMVRGVLFHYAKAQWISKISIASDRTFDDRQRFKYLKEQLTARNSDLVKEGITDKIWTIRDLSFRLVENCQREDEQLSTFF